MGAAFCDRLPKVAEADVVNLFQASIFAESYQHTAFLVILTGLETKCQCQSFAVKVSGSSFVCVLEIRGCSPDDRYGL
jgi:hypothetical protein